MEYILILFWVLLMAAATRAEEVYRQETVCGQKVRRLIPLVAIVAMAPIIIWAGTRTSFSDTAAYIKTYHALPSTVDGLIQHMRTVDKDTGFVLFSGILKLILGSSFTPYFIVIALIQGLIVALVFRKYSESYIISLFLFVASADYLSWMFNGIRQFLAVVIIFAATPLMLKKKYVPLILIILLASTIHQTALLMIPVVFIVQGKPWNIKTISVIALSVLALLFVDQFTDFLDSSLEETQYSETVSTWKEMGDDGVNPIRVLVYAMPALLSLVGRKYIEADNDPVVNLCVNMSILSVAIYLVAMGTSGIMVGRLPIYVSLYGYILLPHLIDRMFVEKSARFVKCALVVMYLLYYYYLMHFAYGRF